MSKNQPKAQDEESFFKFIERAVDLALQVHGVYTPELSSTIGEIVQVAEELSQPGPDFRRAIFSHGRFKNDDIESTYRAIAIFKQALADHRGISLKQVERHIRKYAKK